MSKENGRSPAYPNFEQNEDGILYTTEEGLTKRERFAMAAMQAIITSFSDREVMEAWALASQREGLSSLEEGIADGACRQADALLKELEK